MFSIEASGTFVATTISFTFPAASAPKDVFVPAGGTNPDPQDCAGTPAAPSAAAGYLCVYEGFETNAGTPYFDDVTVGSRYGFSRFGGSLEFPNDGSGLVVAEGTWALTGS